VTAERVHAADLQWRWGMAAPLRWLLVDEFTMDDPGTAVAVCAGIEGLFADSLPEPDTGHSAVSGRPDPAMDEARLIGCRPEPPLQSALDALARGAGAIGEAINGPGGYFGWNPSALHDCVIGGWGAAHPFSLIWHNAAVARTHLAAADGRDAASAVTLDEILQWLTEDGVEVELR
jgi:hypothetical protein